MPSDALSDPAFMRDLPSHSNPADPSRTAALVINESDATFAKELNQLDTHIFNWITHHRVAHQKCFCYVHTRVDESDQVP